jgi:hypothetical protein
VRNEKHYVSYSSLNITIWLKSRRISWEGHVAHTGEKSTVCRVWGGKHAGKRPVGRPMRRWKHNIKTYVK